jgi:hypothetical protein
VHAVDLPERGEAEPSRRGKGVGGEAEGGVGGGEAAAQLWAETVLGSPAAWLCFQGDPRCQMPQTTLTKTDDSGRGVLRLTEAAQ